MQVQVEAGAGCNLPVGCYVGVRLGDVLKQGRYNPAQNYKFPRLERRRNAKIDLYKHVGQCTVALDPEIKTNSEVKISTGDPEISQLSLKVSAQPERGGKVTEVAAEEQKDQKGERAKQVKQQAARYMMKHGIEEKLSDAMKQVLKEKPEDPIEFICRQLLGPRWDAMLAAAKTNDSVPQKAAAQIETKKEKSFVMQPSVGTWIGKPKTFSPNKEAEQAEALRLVMRDQSDCDWRRAIGRLGFAEEAEAGASSSSTKTAPNFAKKASVGTWLIRAPEPKWKAPPPVYVKASWNIQGMNVSSAMSLSERCEVERAISAAFLELTGEFDGGEYFPLQSSTSCPYRPGGMLLHEEADLQTAGLRFTAPDADGRGVFATPDYKAAALVNCNTAGCHVQFLARRLEGARGQQEAYACLRRLEGAMQETMRAAGQYVMAPAVAKATLNLQTLRPPSVACRDELFEVERAISSALMELSGELEGEYFPIGDCSGLAGSMINEEEAEDLLFGSCDEPRALLDDKVGGRGVFATLKRDITVLVNEGSHHVQLIAGQRCQDTSVADVLTRLRLLEDAMRIHLRQEGYELI